MRALRRSKRGPSIDTEAAPMPEKKDSTRWQTLRRIFFWVILFLVLLSLGAGAGAYYGVYQGERDREQNRLAEAEQHYQEGLTWLNEDECELAVAAFEYVLKINPAHPFAEQRLAEAQACVDARPTPTVESVETNEIAAEDLYQEAVAHYEAEEWKSAVSVLTQLRVLDSSHEAETVEEMLFTSLYNAGTALLDEGRFEEGVFYLDQAVALRPLEEEALTQRRLAIQYMTALGYWGVDWERCIDRFGQIYAVAPNYQDVFHRLYNAHVTYADAWYAQEEMCPAEEQYTQALQLINDPEIEQKQSEAAQVCAIATPTPIAPIEGKQAITLTQIPPGFTAGQLAYPVYNTQTGYYDIYALFIDGRLVQMASGADQPSWSRGESLGYRDLLTPGISLLAPGAATPTHLKSDAGATWPTFSPDGGRVAYAVQDIAGSWQIYIAPTSEEVEPEAYAAGKGPTWGPTGWLAWTGCGTDGNCGIFVDNPDDEQPPARKTASLNDIGLNWSPDGGMLAYMSNVTGNWEIYLLSMGGGVVAITDNSASDGLPAWSPDGSHLAFVSNRDGSWGLYLMKVNGEEQSKAITLGPSLPNWTMQRLSWSP